MRFSVLLPTRNGGKYIGDCIRSILDQDYEDLELVVSDNANTDNTSEVIASFSGDPRLKVVRTDAPVSVIDNWNNALNASSGDYILMIGDDDFLLPGYFKRIEEVIEKYDYPQGITYNGYRFIAPDAIDANVQSYYSDPYFDFEPEFKYEGTLSSKVTQSIVRDMFDFKVRFPLNTLPHIWSRKAIDMIDGDIFRPPYPDHFALNALLLKSQKWVVLPDKLFVIGVTPDSYGHYVFNDDKKSLGNEYLGISTNFEGRLPGNELVNNQHVWLSLLKENFKEQLGGMKISRANYVRRQVYYWYCQYKYGSMPLKNFVISVGRLNCKDWVGLVSSIWDGKSLKVLLYLLKLSDGVKVDTFYYGPKPLDNIVNIKEFSDWICSKKTTF